MSYCEMKCVLSIKESNFNAKIGPKIHICLRSTLTMGKWFLAYNSATVGQILMIFSADAHEISILIKW